MPAEGIESLVSFMKVGRLDSCANHELCHKASFSLSLVDFLEIIQPLPAHEWTNDSALGAGIMQHVQEEACWPCRACA